MSPTPGRGTAAIQPIGAGTMHLVQGEEGVLEAGPLGAGIALSLHDPVARVSGMLYFLLPREESATRDPDPKAAEERSMAYALHAVPEFLRQAFELGATCEQTVLCAAGGSRLIGDDGDFQIGRRNRAMLHKLVLRAGIRIAREELGRTRARTLRLSTGDGTTRVLCAGEETILWSP